MTKKKNKVIQPIKPIKPGGLKDVVKPRTENQKKLIQHIVKKNITFSIGAAGCGKTTVAVSLACLYVIKERVNRIIITRPAVEAGEKLGYMPGDSDDKMFAYTIPLFDEFQKYLSKETIFNLKSTGKLEIVPLAHMRGRNFHNCFIIGDEMQNATYSQLKMLITRYGNNSKMVINGDVTQSDLPMYKRGGLELIMEQIEHLDEIGMVRFTKQDVVRHPLVGKILECLDD